MAIEPTMPFTHFKVLVRCLRENGVRLINNMDNPKAGRALVAAIGSAVKNRISSILVASPFMSILSDGSQARKTGADKEMILTRTVLKGKPVCLMTNIADMDSFGGVGADAVKDAIDETYLTKMKLEKEKYCNSVVSATADGAAVNMGVINGTLTQLSHERPWLLKIHCVNHRIELAVKDAMKDDTKCTNVEEFYRINFYLLKNSGALKAKLKQAAEAENITYYPLPKIHGTRFVSHRKRGFIKLLHMWPAFITCYEDAVFTTKCNKTKAKISGLLKKFKSVSMLLHVCSSLDVLSMISPISLTFEKDSLMPYEISTSLRKFIRQADAFIDKDKDAIKSDEDKFINSFLITQCEDPLRLNRKVSKMTRKYPNAGDERKKENNRKFHDVSVRDLMGDDIKEYEAAVEHVKKMLREFKVLVNARFSSFQNQVFKSMKIFDPIFWNTEDEQYGIEDIESIYRHFKVPLDAAKFDVSKAKREWGNLKELVEESYNNFKAHQLWQSFISRREAEFPNITLLMKLIMCISGSNSSVERAFSTLTMILSDRRLSLKHDGIEDIAIICVNDHLWSQRDREEIIESAYNIYKEKRRKVALEPQQKKSVLDAVVIDDLSSDDEDDEDEYDISDISSGSEED